MTSSETRTYTIALNSAMIANVKRVLGRVGWAKKDLDYLVDVGLSARNRWISQYVTYLVDPKANPSSRPFERVSILHAAWDEYDRLTVNSDRITPDSNWTGNINNEIDGWGTDLLAYKDEHGLRILPSVVWSATLMAKPDLWSEVRKTSGYTQRGRRMRA